MPNCVHGELTASFKRMENLKLALSHGHAVLFHE